MDKKYVLGLTVLTLTMLAINYLPQNNGHALITKEEVTLYMRFIDWSATFNKHYREEEEKAYRFLKFSKNHEFVRQHN